MTRLYDYRYIVGVVSEADGSVMYVNNFKHWKDASGVHHLTKIDLAATPVMIPDIARAKAIRRACNGKIWRVKQEDLPTTEDSDE